MICIGYKYQGIFEQESDGTNFKLRLENETLERTQKKN